ncbi:MAG: hypothetical protein RMI91_04505 [Gemmatales bacterium]|nr:hypothetical protein [Gemmatales bacterium]MDW7993897.1 hypothetical protein [Gemmatales bacterium]
MTDAEKQLLTGLVDGILSPEEKVRAEALVRASPEAQQLFAALLNDALRLKYLRREKLGDDFAKQVVELARRELADLARRRLWLLYWRKWASVAVAAVVLPFIAWGTFVLLRQLVNTPGPSPLVEHRPARQQEQTIMESSGPQESVQSAGHPHLGIVLEELEQTSRQMAEQAARFVEQSLSRLGSTLASAWRDVQPLVLGDGQPAVPALAEPIVLTSPVQDVGRNSFRTMELHLPPLLAWERFGQAQVQTVLAQGKFLVLDLSCYDGERTWERIHRALRSLKIPVELDERLLSFWKRRQSTVYFVYIENLSAEQVGEFLLTLHREDTRLGAKAHPEPQIRSVLVQPVQAEGRQRLADLLGLPVSALPELSPRLPSSKPLDGNLQDDTLRKLEQVASGQPLRPPITLAVAFSPLRYPASKQLHQFRQQRGQLRPEAYHLILLIRPER